MLSFGPKIEGLASEDSPQLMPEQSLTDSDVMSALGQTVTTAVGAETEKRLKFSDSDR